MQITYRTLLVALFIVGGVLSSSTTLLAAAQPASSASSQTARPPLVSDAVAMIDVIDVSASLAKAIKAMSDAETQQLTSMLKPSDVYARINFDGTARIGLLMPVREPSDVQRITTVLGQNVSASGQNTAISAGLIAAREVVERERGTRSVVLVVMTDGILSVHNLDLERKRLEEAAAWWKNQTWARRIVVAVGDQKGQTAAKLARSLDAELVGLDDYAKRAIVARAITSARAPVPNPPTTPAPPPRSISPWPWVVSGTALVVLALGWQIRRRSKRLSERAPVHLLAVASLPSTPEMQVSARVTASGQVADTAVAVADLERGVLTLGTGGDVFVPGLPGRAVKVDVTSGSMGITVEPGATVRLNGESVDAMPQPIDVGRQCRLTSGGVAIALRLHARGAELRAPVTVTGIRKRRVG